MSHPLFQVSTSIYGKKWIERSFDPFVALKLKQSHGVSEIISRLLASRGQTHTTAPGFIDPKIKDALPDPYHLKDMDKAVQRVQQALDNKENIAIFGDYDVDGAASSALLYRFFKMIGVEVTVYIPDRIDEGYGPHKGAFSQLKNQGISLIITVDCGTTAFEPLAYAKEIGVDVIVLDHHTAEPKLPEAVAIINPNRLDENSPLTTVAAVGISFIFAVALNSALRQQGFYHNRPTPDLLSLLDLVALGTVCDVMPLHGLNRAFVKQGLKIMARRSNIGLKILCDIAGICEKPTAYHLGFVLGPRINAGGRVGEAGLGSLLLRCDDTSLCQKAAEKLNTYNEERKAIEEMVLEQALSQAEQQLHRPVIMVAGQGWHPGVIGIVAGRLKERYLRPTCVVSFDESGEGKGSGRGVPGMNLGAMVHAARQSNIILGGGGHAMAAGFSLTQDQLLPFHHFLEKKMEALTIDNTPMLILDGALSLNAVNVSLIHELETLAPYGVGNPSPKFAFGHIHLVKTFIIGQNHVKCFFRQLDGTSLEGIAFRCLEDSLGEFLLQSQKKPIHIAGSLHLNTWMGEEKPQLIIEDAAPAL